MFDFRNASERLGGGLYQGLAGTVEGRSMAGLSVDRRADEAAPNPSKSRPLSLGGNPANPQTSALLEARRLAAEQRRANEGGGFSPPQSASDYMATVRQNAESRQQAVNALTGAAADTVRWLDRKLTQKPQHPVAVFPVSPVPKSDFSPWKITGKLPPYARLGGNIDPTVMLEPVRRGDPKPVDLPEPYKPFFDLDPDDRDPGTIDGFLRGLMKDPRYWDPVRGDGRYRDGIRALFKRAYPGNYVPGSWGQDTRPDVGFRELADLAGQYFLGRDVVHDIHRNTYRLAGFDHDPAWTTQPQFIPDAADSKEGNDDTAEAPSPGPGHNGGPDWEPEATDQTEEEPTVPEGVDPQLWSEMRRREDEDFDAYSMRLRKELMRYDLSQDELVAMASAFGAEVLKQPDWHLGLQGISSDDLKNLTIETNEQEADIARRIAEEHGGMLPYGTGEWMKYVLDEDGTVYNKNGATLNRRGFGMFAVIDEINHRLDVRTFQDALENGDYGIAAEIMLGAGFGFGVGGKGGKAVGAKGKGGGKAATGTFSLSPNPPKRAEGRDSRTGGKKAIDHGKNEPHGDGGRALEKVQPQIDALEKKLTDPGISGRRKQELRNKAKKIRKAAEKKKKGETHARKGK